MATYIQYPDRWTPLEYACKCGIKCRIDAKMTLGPSAVPDPIQHCIKDEVHHLPGAIIATWEEHNGEWVRTFPA